MANPTQIRPWTRFTSLRSVPTLDSHTNTQTQTHSSKPLSLNERNTSSSQNNVNTTKSLPPKNQKLKFTTFEPFKLRVNSEIETKVKIPAEEETKSVLVKESIEKQKQDVNYSKEKELGTRVITIAGENRGAYMQITKSKNKAIHKKGNSEGGEVKENVRVKNPKERNHYLPPRKVLYTNSNVQCVKNSIFV